MNRVNSCHALSMMKDYPDIVIQGYFGIEMTKLSQKRFFVLKISAHKAKCLRYVAPFVCCFAYETLLVF